MPKKRPADGTQDSGTDMADKLTEPNPVPPLGGDVVTLKFRQNAFWQGELRMAGETIAFPREEALKLLQTTGFLEAA